MKKHAAERHSLWYRLRMIAALISLFGASAAITTFVLVIFHLS